jgi:hypothetical protein
MTEKRSIASHRGLYKNENRQQPPPAPSARTFARLRRQLEDKVACLIEVATINDLLGWGGSHGKYLRHPHKVAAFEPLFKSTAAKLVGCCGG